MHGYRYAASRACPSVRLVNYISLILRPIFICIFIFICNVCLNVSLSDPFPTPTIYIEPCKRLDLSSYPISTASYDYMTFEFNHTISLFFSMGSALWDQISINVRYVSVQMRLSVLVKVPESKFLLRHSLKFWLYFYRFFSVFDSYILIFVFDKSFLMFFPRKNTLLGFRKCLHTNIHNLCPLTFKSLVDLIVFSVSLLLSTPYTNLWYCQLLISLSNDISKIPGPSCPIQSPGEATPYFSFCNWNLNTLSKDYFSRINILIAHSAIYKYDIISLCETRLGIDENVPENMLPGYIYHPCNHPSGEKKGGVGIFYKDTLPIKFRSDISFDECIVVELQFGRKKIFLTVLYRNPIHKAASPEFYAFIEKFTDLHSKLLDIKPYYIIYRGDFNAHSINWWTDGNSNNEGTQLDILFSELGLTQLISFVH